MPGKLITPKKKAPLLKATPVKKKSVGKKPKPASLIAQRNTRRQEAFLPVDATYINSAPVIVPVELPLPKGRGFLFHPLNHCS